MSVDADGPAPSGFSAIAIRSFCRQTSFKRRWGQAPKQGYPVVSRMLARRRTGSQGLAGSVDRRDLNERNCGPRCGRVNRLTQPIRRGCGRGPPHGARAFAHGQSTGWRTMRRCRAIAGTATRMTKEGAGRDCAAVIGEARLCDHCVEMGRLSEHGAQLAAGESRSSYGADWQSDRDGRRRKRCC